MLEASSVALVGASPRPNSLGERMVTEISRSSRRPLEIHLVNPRHDVVAGRPCLPSLEAIAGPVDLVLLAVPDAALEEQLALAASRGDRSAVIFGSAHEPDGLRGRLTSIAAGGGMALCGAGCMGFVNVSAGLRALGYLERDPVVAGPVALVTHSGSVFSALLRTRRQLGFTLAVSSGQELVTSAADYVDYALSDPNTRVVALVLETLRHPAALRRAFDRAAGQDVVVVALTVGGSPTGRTLVAAHSGALAGTDGAWEALSDADNVVRVADLGELLDTIELFAAGRRAGPAVPGGGIATVHDSGAERALVADLAHQLAVPFATLGPGTMAVLDDLLEPGLHPDNPLDLWGTGSDTEQVFTDALTTMATDDAVDAVALGVDLVPEYDGDDSYPRAMHLAAAATDKPIAVLSNVGDAIDQAAAAELRAAGVPVLEGTRSGLRALGHLLLHRDRAARTPVVTGARFDSARRQRWMERLGRGELDVTATFDLLTDYGIAHVAVRTAGSRDAAVAAARELGFPVVLKTAGSEIRHKSDVGGVVLDLADPDAVSTAYDAMAAQLGSQVLVASTAPAGVELALGLVRDPHLGPLVVVGAGGVLVELLSDRAVRLPPLDEDRAHAMIGGLRIAQVLGGFRGAAPADIGAIAHAVVAFSDLAEELGEVIDALEVNPLRCGPSGCIAVDVLVESRHSGPTARVQTIT
jgi:acetate---CoA ligase (ADP-forming)